MRFLCPVCRSPVYSWGRVLATTGLSPAKCPECSALAAPSWWNVPGSIIAGLLVLASIEYSRQSSSWLPVALAVTAVAAIAYAQLRFIPLTAINARQVYFHRVLSVLLLVALVAAIVFL
jgi:hypothetical protein